MRDILFRGKSIDSGKWLYGYPLIDMAECSLKAKGKCVCPHDGSSAEILFWDDAFHEYDSESVIPDTIGQYTNLTDKNGVKIFEGDILKGLRYYDYGEWGEDKPCKFIVAWEAAKARFSPFHLFDGYTYELKTFEVIGNIHDNPELLEEKNNL